MLGLKNNPNITLTQIPSNVVVAKLPRLSATLTTLTEVIMALKNINLAQTDIKSAMEHTVERTGETRGVIDVASKPSAS